MTIDDRAGGDLVTVDDLDGSGLSALTIDLGRTATINGYRQQSIDGSSFTQTVPDVRYSPDHAADAIVLNGSAAGDTFVVTTAGDTTNVDVTTGAHYTVALLHGIRAEGDSLEIDSLGGDDTLRASGETADNLALKLVSGDGNDEVVGSVYNDVIDSGLGDDTVTGGDGYDVFYDAGGYDTLKESFDRDFLLADNLLVIGQVSSKTPGTSFTSGIAEDLRGIFEHALLTGGDSGNTSLVGDADGRVSVGGSTRTVTGWHGVVSIDAQGGDDLIAVSTRDSVGSHVYVSGGTGNDQLVVDGTDLREDVTLDDSSAFDYTERITSAQWSPTKQPPTVIDQTGVDTVLVRTYGGGDRVLVRRLPTGTPHTIDTGAGDDQVAVGDTAAFTGPGDLAVTHDGGTLNEIRSGLTVLGGSGTDTLSFDDSGDTAANTGVLSRALLTGLGLASAGAAYLDQEWLDVDLGSGNDRLDVLSTHGEAGLPVRTKRTDITTGAGNDTVNVQTIDGPTSVDLGSGSNTVNVGSRAPVTSGGTLDGIRAHLVLTALDGNDTLNVDDSGTALHDRVGAIQATRITGLGTTFNSSWTNLDGSLALPDVVQVVRVRNAMSGRFRLTVAGLGTTTDLDFDATAAQVQTALEALVGAGNVLVTKASDAWMVSYRAALGGAAGWAHLLSMVTDWTDSSPKLAPVSGLSVEAMVTAMSDGWIDYTGFDALHVSLGGGDDAINLDSTPGPATLSTGGGDDVVMIETVKAATTVDGGAGDDILVLNPVIVAGEPSGLGGDLTLVGGTGSDYYLIGLWSQLNRHVAVQDGFRAPVGDVVNPDNDTNTLIVNGSLGGDTFLLRKNVIALLNSPDANGAFQAAEYVTYDDTINGGAILNGLAGDDTFAFDDTSTFMTVNGDSGNDRFLVGQILTEYQPSLQYGIGFGSRLPGDSVFDANFFASTRGWLTNGVSNPVTINGGTGDDLFDIFRNKASLTLNGEDGDDTFIVRTFVADSELTKVASGVGRDVIRYVMNAPVSIDGGDGYDTVVFVGTEFPDTFVITSNGVYGAGRFVSYVNVERLVVDGAEGDDTFYVESTNPNVETRIVGGLGNDTVEVAGNAPAVQADDFLGHSGIVTASIETATGGWNGIPINGISTDIADAQDGMVVITPPVGGARVVENGATSSVGVRLSQAPTGTVVLTVQAPAVNIASTSRVRGVELKVDGGSWGPTATLTFTASNYWTAQTVWIRAIDDAAAEDTRTVVLQTAVLQSATTAPEYAQTMVANTLVTVVDNDAVGVVLGTTSGGGIDLGGPSVVEPYVVNGTLISSNGSTFTYRISLNRAPLGNVTITVDPGSQLHVVGSATLSFSPDVLSRDVTLQANSDTVVEGPHYGYVNASVTAGGEIWSGTGLTLTGRGNEISVSTAGLPPAALATNALRGYLLRIFAGPGEGQTRRIYESFVSNGRLVLATDTDWDILPGTAAGWVLSGYVAPPVVGALTGTVTVVSGDLRTITLTGITLPTADGGLAGAIVRITDGSGPGVYRRIASNTTTSITTVDAWGVGSIGVGTKVAVMDLSGTEIDRLSVAIADANTPGVVVTQSDGSTRLVEGNATTQVTDSYTVRLTQAPGQTIRVYLDPQVTPSGYYASTTSSFTHTDRIQVTLSGAVHVDPVNGRYYVEFDDTNWMTPQVITVTAINDGIRDGNDLQAFAPVARLAATVQGPLFVFGGEDPDPSYNTSLTNYLPIVMPGEHSSKPKPPVLPTIRVDESKQVDRLVLHNEDSPADSVGALTSSRITGLGMAPDTYVAGRRFQDGITYADMEALEIYLGYGSDTFTVDSTHAGTTLIDAGRGNDQILVHTLSGHTLLYGGAGDDTVRVGTTDGPTLNQVAALLGFDGGTGYDAVYLDDHADGSDNRAVVTPTSVTGLGMTAGTDSVWTLRPGTASVVTLVVAGVGFLQFTVGAPTTDEAAAGMRQLTAANLVAGLQHLLFPLGMTYTGPAGPHEVTEADWLHTGCGTYGTSDCAPSVWVHQLGDAYVIGFQGELKGVAVTLQAFDTGQGVAALAARTDGLEYATLEQLDLTTGGGADVFNVRGTGAVSHTDLHTGAGDDRIYVSSLADVPLSGAGSRPDYLSGDLTLIGGTLNIDAGSGRQTLMVSDEAYLGNRSVRITRDRSRAIEKDGRTNTDTRLTSDGELAATGAMYVVGLAGRAITYRADATGNFADGIWLWSGYGSDTFTVTDTWKTAGLRTITWLNTGLGDDSASVTLSPTKDDLLVLDTQGAYNQVVRTVSLYGGDDLRPGDVVQGVILGGILVGAGRFEGNPGDGSVGLFDSSSWTGAAWAALTLTVLRTYVETAILTAQQTLLLSTPIVDGDTVTATVNGVATAVSVVDQTLRFTDGPVTGFVVVRIARTTVEAPAPASYATTSDDDTVHAESSTLPLVIVGGQGADQLHGGTGGDIVLGDRGRILWFAPGSVPTGYGTTSLTAGDLAALEGAAVVVAGHAGPGDKTDGVDGRLVGLVISTDPRIGGNDTITTGSGRDTVIGGAGTDTITTNRSSSSDQTDVVLGDHGFVDYALADGNAADLDRVWSTDPTLGGNDTLTTGEGDDVVIGGVGADTIDAGKGENVVIGDKGSITASTSADRGTGSCR